MNEPIMVIKTPTMDDFVEVVEWALNQGMKWRLGSKSINNFFWKTHESETCIVIRIDKITYCDLDYAKHFLKTQIFDMDQFYNYTLGSRFGLR